MAEPLIHPQHDIGSPPHRFKTMLAAVPAAQLLLLILVTGVIAIALRGHYYPPNNATRVFVDGNDLGNVAIDRPTRIPVRGIAAGDTLTVELRHQAPTMASPADPRTLAHHLKGVAIRYRSGAP